MIRKRYYLFSFIGAFLLGLLFLLLYIVIRPSITTSNNMSTCASSSEEILSSNDQTSIYPFPFFTNNSQHLVFNITSANGLVVNTDNGDIIEYPGYALYAINNDDYAVLRYSHPAGPAYYGRISIISADNLAQVEYSDEFAAYGANVYELKDYVIISYPPYMDKQSTSMRYYVLDKYSLRHVGTKELLCNDIVSINYGDDYLYGGNTANYYAIFNMHGAAGNMQLGSKLIDPLVGNGLAEGYLQGKYILRYGWDASGRYLFVMSSKSGNRYIDVIDENGAHAANLSFIAEGLYITEYCNKWWLIANDIATDGGLYVVSTTQNELRYYWQNIENSIIMDKIIYLSDCSIIYLNGSVITIINDVADKEKKHQIKLEEEILNVAVSRDREYIALNTRKRIIILSNNDEQAYIKFSIYREMHDY